MYVHGYAFMCVCVGVGGGGGNCMRMWLECGKRGGGGGYLIHSPFLYMLHFIFSRSTRGNAGGSYMRLLINLW